ncbi:hypothetical protein BTR14_14670 [Rhizobium rhizosphaerae]|uniref:Phosphatidic acid phosphatase type 2/haloperoxidase domain-containing protein n=1 Tax=Xaviernesmea rhizosphaerae TaxID=1672749 RepID=A0ABX3PBD2_9HYPH|nr:phosphatase PAP2 family protein [Xaviernesmea rhizosphaerae]OQP85707.1 hypothetical protein BTR14_14670 [Xaviernesmea rhizosphaerae]
MPISPETNLVRRLDRDLVLALVLVCLWVALLELFHAAPGIDLWIQGLFFSHGTCPAGSRAGLVCGSFPLGDIGVLQSLRKILFYLPFLLTAAVVARLVWALARPGRLAIADLRDTITVLATMAIGPGLIVNGILKAYSGRPRPMQTELFGGNMSFMPAGSFGGACTDNCSFLSGEASGAAWLVCALILLPEPLRRRLIRPVIAIAVLTSGMRVAFGRHFPSDALLGFLLTLVVFALLRLAMRCLPLPAAVHPSPKSHQ